ncbi:FMN-binding protein [Sphingomonas sp. KRR8]|uniref:FMN-binding protein n=1 Tax=Sphingomonas sp. KRR8 TaxID=2942996 RepID=UPI002020F872|nr:FMN-binding protein [Sphingomonas sp. KRR8]URD60719.1 FMN-binding protein [Sphingomonas sp. KRR8]
MSRDQASWFTLLPAAAVAFAPAALHATVYLTADAARQAMFPGASFVSHDLAFSPEQRKTIAKASGVGSFDKVQSVWEARSGNARLGWFIIDRVLGKHEMITYAVALSADGVVRRVEVLEYRETYGGEIRNPAWRQQFVGKRFGSSVQLGKDIKNISGATLSSRHVTDGVRRLLVTYQLLLRNA